MGWGYGEYTGVACTPSKARNGLRNAGPDKPRVRSPRQAEGYASERLPSLQTRAARIRL